MAHSATLPAVRTARAPAFEQFETDYPIDHTAANLSLTEARDLLDWLENHGLEPASLEPHVDGRMTIRWAA